MKKAYILLTTSFVLIFIALTIGAYTKYSSNISLQEFHKDLATIRGYWAVYGAKELNDDFYIKLNGVSSNNVMYEINATKEGSGGDISYKWELVHKRGSITNDSIYRRSLVLEHEPVLWYWVYYTNQISTYQMEDN